MTPQKFGISMTKYAGQLSKHNVAGVKTVETRVERLGAHPRPDDNSGQHIPSKSRVLAKFLNVS